MNPAAQKFVGKWKSESSEHMEDYMKVLEVNPILRKAGKHATTTIEVSIDGEVFTWKYKIAFKSGNVSFKLGEPFKQHTPDERDVIATVTFEGETMHSIQEGKPCQCIIDRSIEEDGDLMVEISKAKDVVMRRTYRRVKS